MRSFSGSKTDLLMATGDLDGAESRLLQALEVARQQKVRAVNCG